MSAPSCASCRFFAPGPLVEDAPPERQVGQCRRHAPALAVQVRQVGTVGRADTTTEWPTVAAADWCGDHAPQGEVLP